jgi:exopolyphosphatase/guanosine-5'-triphosphate,3'-diphosphate pyrophosphatase
MDSFSFKERSMIRASIDIGTNSVLLLVADVTENGLEVLYEEQHVPRLGKNVDKDRSLHRDSQKRVIDVLKTFQKKLTGEFPELSNPPVITATSAVRDASNRSEFLEVVNRELGWEIRILSGDEEAKTTYGGAVSVLSLADISTPVIIDIGGGSTEFASGVGPQFKKGVSLNIGSVRFTERYFKSDPPSQKEILSARNTIEKELRKLDDSYRNGVLIGVAGTVTSIAAIEMGLHDYESEKLIWKKSDREKTIQHLEKVREIISENEEKNNPDEVKELLWNYAEEVGKGDVLWPTRYALSGRDKSPDPFTLISILGKEKTIQRIKNAINKLNEGK